MSSSAPRVEFHLTGFGTFAGVRNNPTEQLINAIPAYVQAHPLPRGVTVDSATVLETSGSGSREALHALRKAAAEKAEAQADTPGQCHRVWVSQASTLILRLSEAVDFPN